MTVGALVWAALLIQADREQEGEEEQEGGGVLLVGGSSVKAPEYQRQFGSASAGKSASNTGEAKGGNPR